MTMPTRSLFSSVRREVARPRKEVIMRLPAASDALKRDGDATSMMRWKVSALRLPPRRDDIFCMTRHVDALADYGELT